MEQIIDFLRRLAANNNREWFQAHKNEYKECKGIFDRHVEQVIEGIRSFDASIGTLTPGECTYRIYRDTRFSADKTPYKTHMGAFVAPGGKKSGFSGYYFQTGPEEEGYDAGCFIATGNYYAEPPVLRILREDIDIDEEGEFEGAISGAAGSGFSLDRENELKRVPKGYDASHPRADLLRLRNFCLTKQASPAYFMKPDWKNRLVTDFKATKPFLDLINRAITYSREG